MNKVIEINEDFQGQRLDVFLSGLLDIKRAQAQKKIDAQSVLVNGGLKKSSYKLRLNDKVEILDNITLEECTEPLPEGIPLSILFEDEHLLVVNKPKNMLTHPTSFECKGTLVNALLHHTKGKLSDMGDSPLRRGIVHRLDKNTPGLLVVAKTNEAHKSLSEQIREKKAIRRYLAVVLGEMEEDEGTIDRPVSRSLKESVKMSVSEYGKEARTHYRVLERFCGATFLEVELETGRTHQIRVHLASINHPVFGDELYGAKGFKGFAKIKTTEQVLQSTYLCFTHPENSEILEFKLDETNWDDDLKKVLRFFRK